MTLTKDPVEHQLYASILANPADDAPRLIIADWYDENGFDSRARFIRDQISDDAHPMQAFRCDCFDDFYAWSGPKIIDNFQPYNVWYKRGFVWCVMIENERNNIKADSIIDDLVKTHPIQLVRVGKKFATISTNPIMIKSQKHKHLTYVICDGIDKLDYFVSPDIV